MASTVPGSDLPADLRQRFDVLLDRISATAHAKGRPRVRRGHGDSYTACCPAHDDRNPSLSATLEGDRILLYCHAGCAAQDVAAAVGFPVAALFADWRPGNGGYDVYMGRTNVVRHPAVPWEGADDRAVVGGYDVSTHGPVPLPPAVNEFLGLEFEPQEPILGPLSTHQLSFLYSPPGAGKTMFQMAVSHAIASGTDFLGWKCEKPRRVLIIDGEMSAYAMQRRLRALGELGDMLRVANLPGWGADNDLEPLNLCTAAGAELVDFWCTALAADVVILDNLMSLAWMDGVSVNSDEFWTPVRRLCVLLRARGMCVIVVDHTNKSGGLLGTGTKTFHADLAMSLRPVEAPWDSLPEGFEGVSQGVGQKGAPCPTVNLTFSKDRDGTAGSEITFQIGDVGQPWTWEQGAAGKRRMAREMSENGLSIREIAEELSVSKSTVGRWIKGRN